MKKDELESKPTEKLRGELKALQIITGVLVGVLTLLFAVNIYGLIMKEENATFIALTVVAVSCSAILPLQFISMKKIKAELKSREKQ